MTEIEAASPLQQIGNTPTGDVSPEPGPMSPAADRRAPRMLAAVDLGSNSFRMVIAREVGGELQMIDRLREGVRLGGHLDEQQNITLEGQVRAIRCLQKFGERVVDFPPGTVRAVGTNTLRRARNTMSFLKEAEKALGHPIEVVSGQEEARLIFLGVSHSVAGGPPRRLVVDIGGGSTECILGEGQEALSTESLYMGCVSYTLSYFPGGRLTAKRFKKARTAASLELRSIASHYKKRGFDRALGASGTILAVAEILRLQGWSRRGITAEGLERLEQDFLERGHVDQLALEGLRRDRARVLPGGLAILRAVFESFGLDRMFVSSGAMREGVLVDLHGRLRHEDTRELTIQGLVERYHVDLAQAERVETLALRCLEQVAADWKLDTELSRTFLRWAARLHEIGLAIAHGGYHKHGAYILEHSDMDGFSFQNQRLLGLLVRGHRRKFPRELFLELPNKREIRSALRLCMLLRLACLLSRTRSRRHTPDFELKAKGKRLRLIFPEGWLERHPLTRADLVQESRYLGSVGLELVVKNAKGKTKKADESVET